MSIQQKAGGSFKVKNVWGFCWTASFLLCMGKIYPIGCNFIGTSYSGTVSIHAPLEYTIINYSLRYFKKKN